MKYSIIVHPNSNNSVRRGLTRVFDPKLRRHVHKDHTTVQIVKSGHNPVELPHVHSPVVVRSFRSKCATAR